ncbi:MAG: transcription termination factor NusA [Myxococcales bacterium]|nr:transcription termination factor NusA [Myxococcales bacterium]
MQQESSNGLNLDKVLGRVARETGTEYGQLVKAAEQAVLQAAKRHFGPERSLEARYNSEDGLVELFERVSVVDRLSGPKTAGQIAVREARRRGLQVRPGEQLVFQLFYRPEDEAQAKAQEQQVGDVLGVKASRRGFDQIAAQTLKQLILHHTREAERRRICEEYQSCEGCIVSGVVRRLERGDIIVDLGRAEAILPARAQVRRETFRPGDRIHASVLGVLPEARGPQVVLSRASVGFVTKLLAREVPEVANGSVLIEAAAREPGARTKIAVHSRDPAVDSVAACLGPRGSRMRAVVRELRGERVDLVRFEEDPARFVGGALAPATASRIIVDEASHSMEVVVPDDQVSLAIGKRGLNVRLSARLTGWRLDINSESRIHAMREFARRSLSGLHGIDPVLAETLYSYGFRQARDVALASPRLLAQIPGVDPQLVPEMQASARARMEQDSSELARIERERTVPIIEASP